VTLRVSLAQPTDEGLHDETSEEPGGHCDISRQHVQSAVPNAPSSTQHTPPAGFGHEATAFVTELPCAPHVHVSAEIWSQAGLMHEHPSAPGQPFIAQQMPPPTLAAEHADVVSPPHASEWLQTQTSDPLGVQ
jgi:hypothetical protein